MKWEIIHFKIKTNKVVNFKQFRHHIATYFELGTFQWLKHTE